MRYRLRTLLIVLALGPPVLAVACRDRGIALGVFGALVLIVPMFAFVTLIKFCLDAIERRR